MPEDVIDVEVVEDHGGTLPVLSRSAAVEMAVTPQRAKELQDAYHDLCRTLLSADDYQQIGDRSFPKKSAWRKLAVAFNVSTELVSKEYVRDERGRVISAEVVMRATAPNGRFMDGIGVCSVTERCCDPITCDRWLKWPDSGKPTGHVHCLPDCNGRHAFSKPDHDVPATAMTRATNRACSDLFGMGEVSAEEMTGEGPRWDPGTPAQQSRVSPKASTRNTQKMGAPASGKMASPAQIRYIAGLFRDANIAPSDEAVEILRWTAGRVNMLHEDNADKTPLLTMQEARLAIEELKS